MRSSASSGGLQGFLAMINEPVQEADIGALLQQMQGEMGEGGGEVPLGWAAMQAVRQRCSTACSGWLGLSMAGCIPALRWCCC